MPQLCSRQPLSCTKVSLLKCNALNPTIAGGSGFYDEDYDDDYDYDDNYIEHVYGSQKDFSPGYKQKVSMEQRLMDRLQLYFRLC